MATTLPLLRRFGADGPVWHRFGRRGWHSLDQALANPDGDELLRVEQAAASQDRQAREAAEREQRRPACTRCSAKFSNERWEERERAGAWGDDGLCAECRQADTDRKAREEAERERAVTAAVAAKAKRTGFWWRRS